MQPDQIGGPPGRVIEYILRIPTATVATKTSTAAHFFARIRPTPATEHASVIGRRGDRSRPEPPMDTTANHVVAIPQDNTNAPKIRSPSADGMVNARSL